MSCLTSIIPEENRSTEWNQYLFHASVPFALHNVLEQQLNFDFVWMEIKLNFVILILMKPMGLGFLDCIHKISNLDSTAPQGSNVFWDNPLSISALGSLANWQSCSAGTF